ncbi:MAG: GNAT family N-acetyltransferase [Terriglobales bacterium]
MNWQTYCDADLAPLAAVWAAAEAASPHSVYQKFAFARHWAACFGQEIEVRIGWRADPPMVVPVAIRAGCWGLLGEELFDYQDLIGEPSHQQEAAAWASGQLQGPACVTGVAVTSPWSSFWNQMPLKPQPFAAAPVRDAGPDNLAAEHARLERRWQAARVELCRVEEAAARRHALDWLLDRKARACAARGQRNALGERECRWLAVMVEKEAQISELWQLRRRGEALAGLLCWRTPQLRYAYTIGYEPAVAELSPGILALYALLRHTMREGLGFNFLTGEQAFKLRFASRSEPLLRFQTDHVKQ